MQCRFNKKTSIYLTQIVWYLYHLIKYTAKLEKNYYENPNNRQARCQRHELLLSSKTNKNQVSPVLLIILLKLSLQAASLRGNSNKYHKEW